MSAILLKSLLYLNGLSLADQYGDPEILEPSKRPLNILLKKINSQVVVRLKTNFEYKGEMVKCDTYMNIILGGATEYNEGKPVAKYGNIFIRGNNVLYVCMDSERLV